MIVDNLITFGAMGQSVDILTIVLETLTEILKLDDNFTASVGSKVTTLSIACFVKFNTDPVVCPIIESILQILCKNPNCVVEVQERLTPTLISVLNNAGSNIGNVKCHFNYFYFGAYTDCICESYTNFDNF